MALLFSAVRATANDQEVEFFVGGIPREYNKSALSVALQSLYHSNCAVSYIFQST